MKYRWVCPTCGVKGKLVHAGKSSAIGGLARHYGHMHEQPMHVRYYFNPDEVVEIGRPS